MSKHTQGEWAINRETIKDGRGSEGQNVFVGNIFVGAYWGQINLDHPKEKLAQLIAAAPKLLEALELVDREGLDWQTLPKVKAALAKAGAL